MKKLLSLITCFALCAMLVMPVSAAEIKAADFEAVEDVNGKAATYSTGYFTGQTRKMNSWEGTESVRSPISSGSIPEGAVVKGITLNVTVSSGSSGFYLLVESPQGDVVSTYVSRSGEIKISEFNGDPASGTWYVSIISVGTVATATARMRVDYSY